MITTLLFDWDGTLMDSAHLGLEAFRKTFDDLGVPFHDETYQTIYSPNWYSMYEALGLPQHRWEQADRLWLAHYGEAPPEFIEGARGTLIELSARGYRFGLVTSGTCSRIEREVRSLGLESLLEVVICNEKIIRKKPHPEGLQKAMTDMRCRPADCAYIGDTPEDVQMGKTAGVFTVGIPSAYPTSRNLRAAGPDLYLEKIVQLLEHFGGVRRRT